jgi:hypothetical protein
MFDLVGRVHGRRRVLRLVLVTLGPRLGLGLLLPVFVALVVSNRPSGNRSDNERPAPRPSPESHRELLLVCSAGRRCRLSRTFCRIVAS